ncbi:MAG: hypothetical protein CVU88_08205, partial [Firmicutes bacterium HGW-Firmicutes-13]
MNKEKKNHLWIPAEEVTDINKKPTSRNKDRDISFESHGAKLSQGLQEVLSVFEKLRAGDSLSEEDVMIFKVILPEGDDIANRKKFLEDEGLKINVVKDSTHAIVSARKDVFDSLQGRIGRYRQKGTVKNFQHIDGFEPYHGIEKQTASLRRYLEQIQEDISVDVQMMLMPHLAPDVQLKVEKKLALKIVEKNGSLQREPYHLTDGTTIIRAMVPMASVNDIADDQAIYRIEQTVFFHNIMPSVSSSLSSSLQLDPSINVDELPAVVILDDGVEFPKGLESLVPVHWKASDCATPPRFGGHGTPVASRAAIANLGWNLMEPYIKPRAKIIDANIIDGVRTSSDKVIERIKEAVEVFAPVAKIFNFSYNAEIPIEGDEMSFLGCELDLLTRKYGVRFVLSAGNHQLFRVENCLKDVLNDDDCRISEPADA